MHLAAIALGSNLASSFGDRGANLREAVRRIGDLGRVAAVSSFYDTEPVGYTAQPRFMNGALLLETELAPEVLMEHLLAIERSMGRDRTAGGASPPKGPRVVDLDLLLVDNVALDTPALTLPHPELARRMFVLEPLAEIAAGWMVPGTGLSVERLLERLRVEEGGRGERIASG